MIRLFDFFVVRVHAPEYNNVILSTTRRILRFFSFYFLLHEKYKKCRCWHNGWSIMYTEAMYTCIYVHIIGIVNAVLRLHEKRQTRKKNSSFLREEILRVHKKSATLARCPARGIPGLWKYLGRWGLYHLSLVWLRHRFAQYQTRTFITFVEWRGCALGNLARNILFCEVPSPLRLAPSNSCLSSPNQLQMNSASLMKCRKLGLFLMFELLEWRWNIYIFFDVTVISIEIETDIEEENIPDLCSTMLKEAGLLFFLVVFLFFFNTLLKYTRISIMIGKSFEQLVSTFTQSTK